ncbi:beta-galactosidase 3 [Artemisia annua]|uniref:beta-galactosidase n=1 Tax=Artemisia annua TaxID=35608 RepID=A0A2U1LUL9_ARTAN|nr:beta-galactosidase 3 [Artemisia annua]
MVHDTIINLMKKEKFFASQGGPIILAQASKPPNSYRSKTCNSFYCDDFKPAYPKMPKIWIENWPGCILSVSIIPMVAQVQGIWRQKSTSPPEDIAYVVARFFQKGGTVQNYYMYHGGTNFGRTSGGPFITTSYAYDAAIDEYG